MSECHKKIRATRSFYLLDPVYRIETEEKLLRLITNEVDFRGRAQWALSSEPAGNRVKITITAEFIPAKKEEGIE